MVLVVVLNDRSRICSARWFFYWIPYLISRLVSDWIGLIITQTIGLRFMDMNSTFHEEMWTRRSDEIWWLWTHASLQVSEATDFLELEKVNASSDITTFLRSKFNEIRGLSPRLFQETKWLKEASTCIGGYRTLTRQQNVTPTKVKVYTMIEETVAVLKNFMKTSMVRRYPGRYACSETTIMINAVPSHLTIIS